MLIVKSYENEPFEVLLRRFKKLCEKSGILFELKRREFYEKPTTLRKRAKLSAIKRSLKKKLSEKSRYLRLY